MGIDRFSNTHTATGYTLSDISMDSRMKTINSGFIDTPVLVTSSIKALLKRYDNLNSQEFEYLDGRALHMERRGKVEFVMFINLNTTKTIIHEASHITSYIMDQYDIHDDEFRAYICSHVAQEAIEYFKP